MIYPCKTSKGIFGISLNDGKIEALHFPERWNIEEDITDRRIPDIVQNLASDLDKFFVGENVNFEKYPIVIKNGTDFQKRVWEELRRIPFGETKSYYEIADSLNCRAYRAVGGACGKNYIPILIPCHRVINKDGGFGGFSSGLDWKKFLLRCEQK